MKADNFCFWLQGFFELTDSDKPLTATQADLIKTHLALVFKHDPTMAHPKASSPLTQALQIQTPGLAPSQWPYRAIIGGGDINSQIAYC